MSTTAFRYTAVDGSGRTQKGRLEVATREEALRRVREEGMTPIQVSASASRKRRRGRVKVRQISQFTYQLRVLLEARIPISEGLQDLAKQEDNEAFRAVLTDVAGRVEAGETIAGAMDAHRSVFGDTYLETIRAAEQSGTMVRTLDHLSEAIERMDESRRQVANSLLYPACVIATLMLATSFLVIYTIPKFAGMYESRGMDLPLFTRALAGLGGMVQTHWWAVLIGVPGLCYALFRLAKRYPDRVENLLHRVPAVRSVLVSLAVSRFSRVLAVSLSAGLGLIDSIEMGKRASGRRKLAQDADRLTDRIRTGARLADGLEDAEYLPTFARRMFVAGEQTGELVRMSDIVARHFERESSHRIKALTTLIEPLLIVLIAVVVLSIALAIFLPMWNMIQLMS